MNPSKTLGSILYLYVSITRALASPLPDTHYEINAHALCDTAKETLAYLNKGPDYDKEVIQPGTVYPIPLSRIKKTLQFICQHKMQLNDSLFIKKYFDFIPWQPDIHKAHLFSANKPLLKNLPHDRILMTKYYVHSAQASRKRNTFKPYAIYALPKDEASLTLEEANKLSHLTRFQYGKQSILAGALEKKNVPTLAYVSRDDLESALMQGTIIVHFDDHTKQKTLNVHRNNNIEYDRHKTPYEQERYWYFKEVSGIKGYGKDSEYKITVNTEVTFAADLAHLGLGKLLMIQYPDKNGVITTRAGILADTGGAFKDNLYQVDFLAGTYHGKKAYEAATRDLPDYVHAYFMVLKNNVT